MSLESKLRTGHRDEAKIQAGSWPQAWEAALCPQSQGARRGSQRPDLEKSSVGDPYEQGQVSQLHPRKSWSWLSFVRWSLTTMLGSPAIAIPSEYGGTLRSSW